jgi:hypothetical protein
MCYNDDVLNIPQEMNLLVAFFDLTRAVRETYATDYLHSGDRES